MVILVRLREGGSGNEEKDYIEEYLVDHYLVKAANHLMSVDFLVLVIKKRSIGNKILSFTHRILIMSIDKA